MNVALGTDGAIESGNLDMFEVMRFAAMQASIQHDGIHVFAPGVALLAIKSVIHIIPSLVTENRNYSAYEYL